MYDAPHQTRSAPVQPFLAALLAVAILAGFAGLAISRLHLPDAGGGRAAAAAKADVHSAIAAANAYYQDSSAGNYSYAGISRARLNAETPGLAASLRAASNRAGTGYCVEATEDGGAHYAWYTAGMGGAETLAYDRAGCDPATYPGPR